MNRKNKNIKISKGYRLKPSTHNLIKKIQKLIQSTQEEAIGFACRKYYKELMSGGKK
jgi:retron-type reverse transcriptase